jgi:hypothetical protein
MKAADNRMDFVDSGHLLGAPHGIQDAAMAAGCDDDQAQAFDCIASRELVLAVVGDLQRGALRRI